MMEIFERTIALIGNDNFHLLQQKKVLVVGIGGVGGYVCEALVRSGLGFITLVDNDTVSVTNINRQIIALHSTLGMAKTAAMKNRILDINPACKVEELTFFYGEENPIDFTKYDYVVDCIDSTKSKVFLIKECKRMGVPIISSMGTGNKVDPSKLKIDRLSKTTMCPLAKVIRHECKGLDLKVLYSTEEPKKIIVDNHYAPASISFLPSIGGLIIASEVIKDLIGGW